MKKVFSALIALIFAISFSCRQSPESKSSLSLDWQALTKMILKRSDLKTGERVILVAKPGDFDPLIEWLSKEIPKTGALYLGAVSVDSLNWPSYWKTKYIDTIMSGPEDQRWQLLNRIDLGIMLPGAAPSDDAYATLQDALRQGVGRTIHFHWTGTFDSSMKPVAMDEKIDSLYQRAILETDYSKLAAVQKDFEAAMRNNIVTVTTPSGTSIKFRIGDRRVTRQDGDASFSRTFEAKNLIDREIELPAGAIRVAPIEGTVEGRIVFPDGMWNNQKAVGVTMTFTQGMVTNIQASKGVESVRAELMGNPEEGNTAAYSFREFVLGFNPLLAVDERNLIYYYGYGAGIVRLSLGNNQELGGNVSNGDYVRISFFTDATVTIGDEVWVKDGKLVKGN